MAFPEAEACIARQSLRLCLLGPGSGFPHHRGSDGDEQSCLQTLGPWGPGVPSREDVSGSCIATPGA